MLHCIPSAVMLPVSCCRGCIIIDKDCIALRTCVRNGLLCCSVAFITGKMLPVASRACRVVCSRAATGRLSYTAGGDSFKVAPSQGAFSHQQHNLED